MLRDPDITVSGCLYRGRSIYIPASNTLGFLFNPSFQVRVVADNIQAISLSGRRDIDFSSYYDVVGLPCYEKFG